MISVQVAACLAAEAQRPAQVYRIAGRDIVCDTPLGSLAAYRAAGGRVPPISFPPDTTPECSRDAAAGRSVRGWLGGDTRQVVCLSGDDGFDIGVSGVGRFRVSTPAGHIRCIALEKGVARGIFEEVLIGPPLVLSLALGGVWCLHAAAVDRGGRAALLLGQSGQGKSTLARFMSGGGGFRQVADDILPCALKNGRLCAHADFPQLKHSAEDQAAMRQPPELPVAAVYSLAPLPPQASEPAAVGIFPFSPSRAALELVRHSVAGQLFSRQLLERHLAFCAQAAGRVPVRTLRYPKRRESLPAIRDAIASDLGRLAAP